jgi:hypothetical protein
MRPQAARQERQEYGQDGGRLMAANPRFSSHSFRSACGGQLIELGLHGPEGLAELRLGERDAAGVEVGAAGGHVLYPLGAWLSTALMNPRGDQGSHDGTGGGSDDQPVLLYSCRERSHAW